MLVRGPALVKRRFRVLQALGAVMSAGGFKLDTDPDTVREPDVAFVRRERIPEAGVPDGLWPGPPDPAVEIRSPGDRSSEIREKVDEYLALGVRLEWVADSKARTLTVHRPASAPRTLDTHGVLNGGEIVTVFSCPVRRTFE